MTATANFGGDLAPTETAYYLNNEGDSPRTIKAWVNREPAATPEEFAEGKVPQLEIIVRNDSTYGIALSEFDKGDKIRIGARVGGSTEDYLLPAPAAQSATTLTFRIGK